jgi:uncharacterized NAD(P)/FAD-binding protein YdhS
MYPADDPGADRGPVIAVVGGGASGTLATVYLLREAAGRGVPLRVALIDRHGRHGLGRAYSTTHPAHLLNSPAAAMSAVAGDPGHLTRWAAGAGLPHDEFLPRSAYGRYLTGLLTAAERSAQPAARVSRITSQVVAIRRGGHGRALRLHLAADGRIDADAVVLATGNLPPAPPCPVPLGHRYIADPWEPGALEATADGSPVAVLGTGLTMLDVAIALTGAHPDTAVHAISRHALLPREHHWPRPAATASALPAIGRAPGTPRLARLIREIRASAAAYPGHWQNVVDALRPQIPRLWEQLPEQDKRLFLRHVARYWEVHRHRVPHDTASRAAAVTSAGRLTVHRGHVTAASAAACGSASTTTAPPPSWPPAGSSTAPGPPPTSPPPPTRSCAICLTRAWPGRTRCGWDWTPTPAAPCATRAAGPPATSSPWARRCADAGTRPPPSRKSATRRPCSPIACSPDGGTPNPAAPHNQSTAGPIPGTDHRQHSFQAAAIILPAMVSFSPQSGLCSAVARAGVR